MIEDKPLTGFGPGQWQVNYRKTYKVVEESRDLGHAHNNFLHIAAESGLIGVAGFTAFWLFFLAAYIFMFGMSDYTWGKSDSIREFWFVISLLLVMKDGSEKE